MDPTDTDIIRQLLEGSHTVHELSKALFNTEDREELRKHNSFLRYRLGRLAEEGLVRVELGRVKRYHIPVEEMIQGSATLVVNNGRETIEMSLGEVLVTEEDDQGQRKVILL